MCVDDKRVSGEVKMVKTASCRRVTIWRERSTTQNSQGMADLLGMGNYMDYPSRQAPTWEHVAQ